MMTTDIASLSRWNADMSALQVEYLQAQRVVFRVKIIALALQTTNPVETMVKYGIDELTAQHAQRLGLGSLTAFKRAMSRVRAIEKQIRDTMARMPSVEILVSQPGGVA